jgi:hypothetical protein
MDVQIGYAQPLDTVAGTITYRYPMRMMGETVTGPGLSLQLDIETVAGFEALGSPSHALDVQWGTEAVRCPPQSRCGFTSGPSRRKRVVRMLDTPGARARDFVLAYTPSPPPARPPADPDAEP